MGKLTYDPQKYQGFGTPASPQEPAHQYEDFKATQLFCPKCKTAMPVKEKLLLYLPDGDLYDYRCVQCHTSVGSKKAGR